MPSNFHKEKPDDDDKFLDDPLGDPRDLPDEDDMVYGDPYKDDSGELYCDFYKEKSSDKIWWTTSPERLESALFSFDQKKVFRLFRDYPHKLTKEQKEIFDKENPFWKDFFSNRQ